MSSRRNGSISRAAETASKNRLHMDRNPQHSRITDPSNPAGRRKEIDNVMKRARQSSPGSWDRKLLEVEEKDPNRSPIGRRTRSPISRRSRSPIGRRSRSPIGRRTRSPIGTRNRSPIGRRTRSPIGRPTRSPIARPTRSPVVRRTRSPIVRRSRTPAGRRSRSPVVNRRSPVNSRRSRKSRSRSTRKSPRRTPRRSPARRPARPRSPVRGLVRAPPVPAPAPGVRAPPARTKRPPSPPSPASSGSGSSVSSCSDESCSVCSGKNKKGGGTKQPKAPRSGSASPGRAKRPPAASTARAVQPTKELLKARETSKRTREEKVLEWQRSQLAVNRGAVSGAAPATSGPISAAHIKREGERRPPGAPPAPPPGATVPNAPSRRARGVSPAAIAAALNDSDSDSESDASSDPQPQRLTLSERFGKMAQWSADRSARLENMRITRRESTLHVRIERDPDQSPERELGAEPGAVAPSGVVGSYPEELLAAAPGGLPSWDDVRVRYDYYKKRGYLRGLTLSDYVKWEEWWYKYQEWLKRERAYERWAEEGEMPVRRERRKRGGRHRRS